MNWLDILLLLPLLIGLTRGLMHGLISEIIAFAVVILGVVGARMFGSSFSAWLMVQFAWQQEVCDIVAYALLFLLIAVLLSIGAHLLNKFMHAIHLSWVNRLLGGLFGICKYGLLVLIVVFLMNKTNESLHWLDDSTAVQTSLVYPQMVKIVNLCCTTFL